MQTGINGCEIYKNVRMMHAVVFADRAPEAKNAQVIGENQNSKGFKMLFLRPFGGQKSETNDRNCLKLFFENVLPTVARSTFLEKYDANSELEHKNYESGVL